MYKLLPVSVYFFFNKIISWSLCRYRCFVRDCFNTCLLYTEYIIAGVNTYYIIIMYHDDNNSQEFVLNALLWNLNFLEYNSV